MSAIVSQYIFINSADRVSGNSNDFQVFLKDIKNDFEDVNITIQNLSILNSFYPINSNNNVISIGATAAITATITPGNYTSAQFITEFVAESSLGITGAYSSNTGKFSFGSTNGMAWSITANANQPFLGLTTGTHNSSGGVITSDAVVNLSGAREVRILTDIPIYSTNSHDDNKNILISVYPNANFNNMINYSLQNFAHVKLSTSNIGLQRFTLVNEFGELLNTNNTDWSMTLLLTSNSLQF
jgi:hypothetical protein